MHKQDPKLEDAISKSLASHYCVLIQELAEKKVEVSEKIIKIYEMKRAFEKSLLAYIR